jgi:phosphoribosyl 1,2-cyclic phosphate phosphodiesterase
MRVLFLGSGTSFGVPVIGCGCPVCTSSDPRDARYRASILIEANNPDASIESRDAEGTLSTVVVDAGPEFRLQALRARITRLDALLLTHAHADHVGGLDDVRPLTRERILPVYGNAETLDETRERFSYIFRETQEGGGKPRIELRVAEGPVRVGALEFVPVPVRHGRLPILGWRSGTFAYITDCSELPSSSLPLLEGVETLVINGLRRQPHATHFSLDQGIEAARRIGAKHTWLTHMNHESTHVELEEYCARRGADVGAAPAWDGLELEI